MFNKNIEIWLQSAVFTSVSERSGLHFALGAIIALRNEGPNATAPIWG